MANKLAAVNMLKQQIRTHDILDESLLNTFEQIPREQFVPDHYVQAAYADIAIPIGHNQFMLTPLTQGRILQALQLSPEDKVLEVGTGMGYLTALIAAHAQHVYSVEIHEDFLKQAQQNIEKLGIDNVTLQLGNGAAGWDKQQPYDVICLTGSVPMLADTLLKQLKVGGRLFAVIGKGDVMQATLVTRTEQANWQYQSLFETAVPGLIDAPQLDLFQF